MVLTKFKSKRQSNITFKLDLPSVSIGILEKLKAIWCYLTPPMEMMDLAISNHNFWREKNVILLPVHNFLHENNTKPTKQLPIIFIFF